MSDLISRKWLMECVDEGWIKFDTEKDKNTYVHLVRDIAPSAQPEQHWIPISKKTNPTKSGWYLVTVHEDATIDNERFTGIAEFDATNGVWYDMDEPTDMYLRWMPLPEPYRKEGD